MKSRATSIALAKSQQIFGHLFIAPAMLGVFCFYLYPIVSALLFSFTNYNLVSPDYRFIGLDNYKKLLDDPLFWKSVLNTLYFAAVVLVTQPIISLTLAVFLNKTFPGRGLVRTFSFLPVVTPVVVVSILWTLLYNYDVGLINGLLARVKIPPQPWLVSPKLSMPSIIIMTVWKNTGFFMIAYLAGLQSIPGDLYESARIDGARAPRIFVSITIPLIERTTLFVVVISMLDSFKIFTQVYLMTQGGPIDSTTTMTFYMYLNGFKFLSMGYACAQAFIMLLIVGLITALYFRVFKTEVEY